MGAAARPLSARVAALAQHFDHILATRMQGMPMLNPALHVATVGFEPGRDGEGAVGILITPWFMNLVWLPLDGGDTPDAIQPLRTGETRARVVGNTRFHFIGAREQPLGYYETCSLFSPMFEFEDQSGALATADAVLATLRRPHEAGAFTPPSRRGFLFGGQGG